MTTPTRTATRSRLLALYIPELLDAELRALSERTARTLSALIRDYVLREATLRPVRRPDPDDGPTVGVVTVEHLIDGMTRTVRAASAATVRVNVRWHPDEVELVEGWAEDVFDEHGGQRLGVEDAVVMLAHLAVRHPRRPQPMPGPAAAAAAVPDDRAQRRLVEAIREAAREAAREAVRDAIRDAVRDVVRDVVRNELVPLLGRTANADTEPIDRASRGA